MKKEEICPLLENLDRLGLGVDSGDAAHGQESIRGDALLVSAILVPLFDSTLNLSQCPESN